MPKAKAACVVRSKDGRFFDIPEDILRRYQVRPETLSAAEKRKLAAPGASKTSGHSAELPKGLVQVIINVPPGAHLGGNGNGAHKAEAEARWIYEAPTVGAPMEWGDDLDPTGGMSSASRRG